MRGACDIRTSPERRVARAVVYGGLLLHTLLSAGTYGSGNATEPRDVEAVRSMPVRQQLHVLRSGTQIGGAVGAEQLAGGHRGEAGMRRVERGAHFLVFAALDGAGGIDEETA